MSRLVLVSNRVPDVKERVQSAGGLIVGLGEAVRDTEGLWFGWSGQHHENAVSSDVQIEQLHRVTFATIDLTTDQYTRFYENFANGALWPLCHYRLEMIRYRQEDYDSYKKVNALFARKLAPLLREDDVIWVHDYHLMMLGAELKKLNIRNRIGYFLHIPLPPWSVTRVLPCAGALLSALSEYDLIGVQTEEDRENFNSCFSATGLSTRVEHFPIGIAPEEFREEARRNVDAPEVVRLMDSLRGRKLVIGVDRLDYSKGIPERIKGFEKLIQRYPQHEAKVVMLQIAPVSRAGVSAYQHLRREVDELSGHVNATFGTFDWTPVRFLTQSVPRHVLAGFHRRADIALVTPLRDGMNLVAKEYVAAQDEDDPGVLILSSLAGAAPELKAALQVNPYDPDQIAEALHLALTMKKEVRKKRWRFLNVEVQRNTAARWAAEFLSVLKEVR
ncbi:Trehalose 6-phosphate synthase [Acetobacteraceae bacterium EV16G]|uniref:Trehalose 6-phosphate synthase n=1 Tax=Sorlinia euscelidii TaxID=3081148 RepID=A0ABU7U078_9PROT